MTNQERKFDETRWGSTIGWIAIVLFILGALTKLAWIYTASSARGISFADVTNLLIDTQNDDTLMNRRFGGVEVSIVLHAVSAWNRALYALWILLLQIIRFAWLRRERILLDQIRSLEEKS